MPRVIKPGKVEPKGPPPAGIRVNCGSCGATLETTDDEPSAQPTVIEEAGIRKAGWYVTCPECGYKLFVPRER